MYLLLYEWLDIEFFLLRNFRVDHSELIYYNLIVYINYEEIINKCGWVDRFIYV